MPDPSGWVKGGAPAWGNGFLPATFQGTLLRGGESPILNLSTPKGVSAQQQTATVDLINQLNRDSLRAGDENSELAARISAYELAFRMQSHAPEVVDISSETDATRRLYGLDDTTTELAHQIAAKSTAIMRLGRDSFYRQQDMDFKAALEYLHSQVTLVTLTEDSAEGRRAFFEKRKPEFKGR